jgi:hypothetical protein
MTHRQTKEVNEMSPLSIKSIVEDVHAGEMSTNYGVDLMIDLYFHLAFESRIREILHDVLIQDLAVADAVEYLEELL